ncbi:hypothetical protein LCGC14_1499960 [marine sediment metagenome]|uniref:Uncharacterized protein n=1 Tax=marine sediment metagenome TaxID=412755 RepID=A0A0F9JQ87_9ZZZZ
MKFRFALPNYVFLLLIVAAIFTIAAMLIEPWNTILFLVAIPLIQQAYKLYKDRTGRTLSKVANQTISFALALIFVIISGGFAGIIFPALPNWNNDLILFLGDALVFARAFVVLMTVAWGSLMALYEGIWDKLFVLSNTFATVDKRRYPVGLSMIK